MVTENQQIGASLLVSFYNNVTILKQLAARQLNLLAPILYNYEKYKTQQKEVSLENLLTETDAAQLKVLSSEIRGTLQYVFYDYEAIHEELGESQEDFEKIKTLWEEMQFKPHLDQEKINELIRQYNKILAKEISREFFQTGSKMLVG